jgi:gliding motility-associated-like protein
MGKLFLLSWTVIFFCFSVSGQNPATIFTIPDRNIVLPCGTNCTAINFSVPYIKETNTYTVTYPPYRPYSYATPGGIPVTSIYIDDMWSQKIQLPPAFTFCFFGISYPSLLMGSNSAITFDTIRAGTSSGYSISATTGAIPNTAYAPSMIFGPYHDIDPSLTTSPNRKIEYRIEGTAPQRRFIASYFEVPLYGNSCSTPKVTHQMVLYENTGVIEVYIHDKPFCTGWNNGLAILGIQNKDRNLAIAAQGKNATVWGSNGMDSAFRFVPSGASSLFKRAELVLNNTVVATNTTDTSTGGQGILNITFPNVCPASDSSAYLIRVVYGSCNNPAIELSFADTVFIKKNTLAAATVKTDATCFTPGSVIVNAAGGVPPLQYSVNGEAYQNSNAFSNLQPGTYNFTTRDASSCVFTCPQVTVALQDTIITNAGADTSICFGASFIRKTISTGITYNWTPATGISNPAIANPVFSPQATTAYTVTASAGNCTSQSSFKVTVFTGADANAGPDAVIITGDVYQMTGAGSPGTYSWTPAKGLTSSSILNPYANPGQTTTYSLKVTTPQGCVATDDMVITVVPYCIKPMEAFTPNGDGINDLWVVSNGTSCIKKLKVQVFNRYGAKVFESGDYKNNWNGTYDGKPLTDGTYYFVVSYQLINGRDEFLKGSLTILR